MQIKLIDDHTVAGMSVGGITSVLYDHILTGIVVGVGVWAITRLISLVIVSLQLPQKLRCALAPLGKVLNLSRGAVCSRPRKKRKK